MKKLILDVACGGKMFWFDKNNPHVLFCDKRRESMEFVGHRKVDVDPDVICDFTNLPFADESYKMVVFDPPHLTHAGETSWIGKKYGRLPKDWQPLIKDGFDECMRVLEPYGVLVFKWSEVQIPVSKIIDCIGKSPLFGHRSGKASNTHWMCFMKGIG